MTEPHRPIDRDTPWAGTRVVRLVVPAVYFLFVAGEFALTTTIALSLTDRGASALAVGVLASSLWVGILAASLAAHHLVSRHGHARVFVGAAMLAAVAAATMPWHEDYAGWLVAAAVLGLGAGWVWVAGESWLAESAPREQRGLYVGLFETAVGLGLMTGPALVKAALALGLPPMPAGAVLVAVSSLASLPLLAVVAPAADAAPTRAPAPAAVGTQPAVDARAVTWSLAVVAAGSGLMESGLSSLLPSISMRLGFEMATAALLGAVIGAGSALLQVPFGALADHVGMPRAMGLAWMLTLVALLALVAGWGAPAPLFWIAGFVLGGVGGAVYTLVVIELGHRLAGAALVRAMGLLVTAYTIGSTAGPALGGALFDRAGLAGLAGALLGAGMFVALLAWRAVRAPVVSATPPARAASRR